MLILLVCMLSCISMTPFHKTALPLPTALALDILGRKQAQCEIFWLDGRAKTLWVPFTSPPIEKNLIMDASLLGLECVVITWPTSVISLTIGKWMEVLKWFSQVSVNVDGEKGNKGATQTVTYDCLQKWKTEAELVYTKGLYWYNSRTVLTW